MRIEKKTLNDALRMLGKVVCQTSPVELYRSVRFVGDVDGVMAMATDGVEVVSVILDAFAETEIDFCVPFKDLKDQVRIGRSETIELTGTFIEFPEQEEPAADAMSAILPVNFSELLAQAAPLVDRTGYRRVLHGINLSNAGVTVTDGKQLLHLPCALSLAKDVTIPFPSALLAAKTSEMGTLQVWDNLFQIEIGNVSWHGKLLEGQYPNWRSVIPTPESRDYSITLHEPEKVLNWVKMIPSQKTTNGVEFNVMPDGSVTLVSCIQPNFELNTQATVSGVQPRAVLTLDREIILRMLLQGYNTFSAHSDGLVPVIASGGAGQYIAMSIRTINKNPIQPKQEEKKMEIENNVVEQTAPVVNPLDELGTAIEELKIKLKAMLDESSVLSREGSRKTLEYLTRLDDYRVKWHSYTEEYISSLGIFADAIISIMAALAKQERIRISERTKAGLERIRKSGKTLGRPQTANVEKVKQLREQGLSLSAIAKECGISKTRVHQILAA